MKLAANIFASLIVMAVCLWMVWPNPHNAASLRHVFAQLSLARFWPYLAGFVLLLGATHFFRAWRWNNLLRPIGVTLPAGKLLAISSVGFMAIMVLPARLGEFVRPALVREKGKVSGSAVLGTVAVERIVDGLLISIMVFACSFARRGPDAPYWMMPMAYTALGVFVAAITGLLLALIWPTPTVTWSVRLTGMPYLFPRAAKKLEALLHKLVDGFRVLSDWRQLGWFVGWSTLYWVANGLGTWVLARGFGLDLPVVGAFATMGVIAVGITLPNSPGLVGQFHWLTLKGLSLYLPMAVVDTTGLAFALVLHGVQVVWYLGVGRIAMSTSHTRMGELLKWRRQEKAPASS